MNFWPNNTSVVGATDSWAPMAMYKGVPATTSLSLNYLVVQQIQALQEVAEQNTHISTLINTISKRLFRASGPAAPKEQQETVVSTRSGEDEKLLKIVLEQDLHLPVLKERGFELIGSVKSRENVLVPEAAGTCLTVSLYSQDCPTSPLKLNIAGTVQTGKHVIRGTVSTEVQADGTFSFANIVINEVSSHYLDDAFTLVVSDAANELKPLVIKRLSVRARKSKAQDTV